MNVGLNNIARGFEMSTKPADGAQGIYKHKLFKVQAVPYPNGEPRVESGAVQFGDRDWPGLFLRGDDAINIAMQIDSIGAFLNSIPDELKVEKGGVELAMAYMQLKRIRDTIMTDVVVKNENGN